MLAGPQQRARFFVALTVVFGATFLVLTDLGSTGSRLSALAVGSAAARQHDGLTATSGSRRVGAELPATRQTIGPGDIANFLVHNSPTTQIVGDDGSPDRQRVLRWAPDGVYSAHRTYAVLGFRMLTGAPGRMYDWHTQPNDVGGWYPPCSGGVAPLAIDYWGNSRGLLLVVEPENIGCSRGKGRYHFRILNQAEVEARRGKWVWLWMEMTWGRRDLPNPGSVRVWVAGEKRPRVSISGVNTHWPQQQMVTFWEGIYHHRGSPSAGSVEIAATRFGRTPQEAYQDVPTLHTSFSNSAPNSSSLSIARRRSTEAAVPAALKWGIPGTPSKIGD